MLNALKEKAHMTAVEHGFHDEEKPDCYWLGLVMSEAGEAINADRKGRHADTKRFEEVMEMRCISPRVAFEGNIKDSVEDEIADIVIRLLDFAGLKRYGLRYERNYELTNPVFWVLEHEGLSSALFQLNYALGNAYDRGRLEEGISWGFMIYSECFEKMTGSDKDLWWFVEKKMRYNDLRPRLNGKKY